MNELWAGDFGNDYTKRHSLGANPHVREWLWEQLLPPNCESVLEVGANAGLNLEAIARSPRHCTATLYACEPNDLARAELLSLNLTSSSFITADYADKLSFPDHVAEVAITCGVLIHIPTDKLLASMREIHRCSARTIICAEYFAPSEEMIPYRGHNNALWRRDYGSLWLDNFPDLHCVQCLFAWKRITGLDNLTIWVLQRGPRRH